MDSAFYSTPGPLTTPTRDQTALLRALDRDPEAMCRAVQGLLVHPGDAFGAGLSPERLAERNTRPAHALLQRALELDPSPLDTPRAVGDRVVGTCRHFAVLATAFLRAVGVVARARCGFAGCLDQPRKVDHWITEYWSDEARRWIRADVEHLDSEVVESPHDLRPGEFLSGGEAWQAVRAGDEDAMAFGVAGTDKLGTGRDPRQRDQGPRRDASVDEWGPMEDSYQGRTGDDFDRLINHLATVCAGDDLAALQDLYRTLAVPTGMIR